jgi:hypothetical protein
MNSQTHDARWVSFGPAVRAFRISKATSCRLAMTWVLFVCALPLTAMAGPVAVFKGSFSRIEDRSTDSRRIAGGCFVVFDVEAKTHTEIIFYERAGEKLYEVDSFTQDTLTVTGPEGRRKITFADARAATAPGDLARAYHEIGGILKQLAITGGPGNDKPTTVVFPRTLTGIQLQNLPDSFHLRQQLIVTVQSQLTELANKAGRSEAEVVANLQAQLEARGYSQD